MSTATVSINLNRSNNYCDYIKGFIRFECEVKKKML